MKLMRVVFKNRWLKLTLSVIVLQQALVASGTFLMGELAGQASTRELDPRLAALLFLCVALPGSVVHYGLARLSTRAEKSILVDFFRRYFAANFNHPAHWRNEDSRRERHDVMCRTGQDAIQSSIRFAIDASATVLNVAFNTVSIILITNRKLGAAILIAGALGLWIIHAADARISKATQTEMQSENQLNAHLSRSWDNIALGNRLFFERWRSRFDRLFAATTKAALENVSQRDRMIAAAGFVTTSIVVGTGLGLAWIHRGDRALVVALLIMLPRSLQVVMHIQVIQTYWAQWKSLREKLAITEGTLETPAALSLERFVQREKIQVRGSCVNCSTEELAEIQRGTSGRYTLLGPNGAGKSTLLLDLKTRLGERAIYLPTHHQLELREESRSLSSGQKAISLLEDVASQDSGILLLDEWDANLSNDNLAAHDAMIDQLSRERIVVEVRHLRA